MLEVQKKKKRREKWRKYQRILNKIKVYKKRKKRRGFLRGSKDLRNKHDNYF